MDSPSSKSNSHLAKSFAQSISSFYFHGKSIVERRQFFGKFLKPIKKNNKFKKKIITVKDVWFDLKYKIRNISKILEKSS